MTSARWYSDAVAKHERALASPQRFPLTGDGEHTWRTLGHPVYAPRSPDAEKLKAARYRDWKDNRTDTAR